MPNTKKPRAGSLQFWPRVRAKKILPSANWKAIEKSACSQGIKGILGFFGYKVGMVSLVVKDNTQNSLTKGKQIILPATLVEFPGIKIAAILFYKGGKRAGQLFVEPEKELKRILKVPKQIPPLAQKLEELEKNLSNYDNLRLLCYSLARKAFKKAPDIAELALGGNMQEKLEQIKDFIGKELSIEHFAKPSMLVDIYGVTKGKGIAGPVARFGVSLKSHKTEKGRRRPGSLGPWKPAHVSFRVAMAGQLGYFTRVQYNNKIISIIPEKDAENINHPSGFKNYGIVKNPCLLIKGSLQGTPKRPLLLTIATRPTRSAAKESYELLKIQK